MSSQSDLLALLEAAGADGLPHAKASLLEHLLGTYTLLAQWGNSSQLCNAGLFHSVYGTEHYHFQCMDPAQREKVKEAIGAESESLVFEFGQSSLYELLQSNPACPGEDAESRASLTCQLLEIHAANLADQWDAIPSDLRAKIRARDSELWLSKKSMLSHGAFAALAKAMAWEGN